MASFVLSFFPLDVLDEIWDLIGSVSEGSLTYSYYNPKIRGASVKTIKYLPSSNPKIIKQEKQVPFWKGSLWISDTLLPRSH